MKQYIGYIEKESPLRYEVKENEINKPLPVYATDEKIKRCKCGSKLVLLYYEANDVEGLVDKLTSSDILVRFYDPSGNLIEVRTPINYTDMKWI